MKIISGSGATGALVEISRLRAVAAAFVIAAAAALLVSCGGQETANTGGGEPQASLADITADPEEFYGESVTVDGAIAYIIDSTSFIIAPQEELDEENPEDLAEIGVLITTREDETPGLSEGQTVQVSGAVREVNDEFAREYEIQVDDKYYGAYAPGEGPAIAADSVRQTPGGGTTGQ